MRRDFEVIRNILLRIGDLGLDDSNSLKTKLNISQEVLEYHLNLLLNDASLLKGDNGRKMGVSKDNPTWINLKLTWEGNDFLDAIGDEKEWTKVKKALNSGAKLVTMEALKHLAKGVASVGLGVILAEGGGEAKGQAEKKFGDYQDTPQTMESKDPSIKESE